MDYTTAAVLYTRVPNTHVANDEYLFWHPYWIIIRDCIMGEIMIKRRSKSYLPKMESQDDEQYRAYLNRSVFYNMTSRTVNAIVGAVHMREPIIESAPENFSFDNLTRDGQSMGAFAKRITREIVTLGRYGVLIDAPEQGGDPYFAGYLCEDILDVQVDRNQGRDRITKVVLREFIRMGERGLTHDMEEYYRVLLLDETGVYRQRVYPTADLNGEYRQVTPLKNGEPMTYIPFLVIGPYDFGTDIEKPPMLDIALMNIAHYQCYAQLQAGRFYTATPIWAVFLASGGTDDLEFRVGNDTVWQLGANDKADLIEFSGSGLAYLESALTMLEHQIASIGGKMGSPSRGVAAESSDSVAMRERGEASFLQSILTTISDAMTMLMREIAQWRGTPAPKLKVKYAQDALDMYMTDREVRAITQLWKSGMLPVEALYAIFKDANILPPSMGLDEFRESLPNLSPETKQKVLLEREKGKIARRAMKLQAETQRATQPADEEDDDPEEDSPGTQRQGNND